MHSQIVKLALQATTALWEQILLMVTCVHLDPIVLLILIYQLNVLLVSII